MAGQLGCAEAYQAVVHFQGGTRTFLPLEAITKLTWGRKLDDYSEASVTIAKPEVSPDCCRMLGQVTPWAHELSLYRDEGLIWQGPIVQKEETRTEVTLDARDMLMWFDRRVIDTQYGTPENPDAAKYKGEVGKLLQDLIAKTYPPGDPYNNPGITEWARIDNTPGLWFETDPIWRGSRTVGDLVREVIKVGIDMFTMGRRVYLIPDAYRIAHSPYRLTSDDFLADLTVRENGLDTATEGFVMASPDTTTAGGGGEVQLNPPPLYAKYPPGHHGGEGDPSAPAWFGRITKFSQSQGASGTQDDQGNPVDVRALEGIARAIRGYGFPTPRSILVPDGAQLSPEAPVGINQLVPGRTVRVELGDFCTPVHELFRLNEVEVEWTSSDVEKVAISLVTMRQPPVEEGGS